MAKVGYIFIATNGEEYAEDKAWMQQYGCVQVIEELSEHESCARCGSSSYRVWSAATSWWCRGSVTHCVAPVNWLHS